MLAMPLNGIVNLLLLNHLWLTDGGNLLKWKCAIKNSNLQHISNLHNIQAVQHAPPPAGPMFVDYNEKENNANNNNSGDCRVIDNSIIIIMYSKSQVLNT